MKKPIDKLCLQGNNVITLIKRFVKHKIKQNKKGGNNYVTAGNDKSRRNYFQRGSGSGGKGKSGVGKDYEYWCLWIRYSCLPWKTSVYKISGNTGT